MSIWQGRSRRKKSGGRLRLARKKRKFEIGSDPVHMSLGETRKKSVRGRGGTVRHRLLRGQVVNVSDPKDGSTRQVKMITVVENPANPNYVRRNLITKGAIVETESGRARITSRPGQDGVVNAVLIR